MCFNGTWEIPCNEQQKRGVLSDTQAKQNEKGECGMGKRAKIVMVGGGSVSWSPTLISDLLYTEGLEQCQYVHHDIDEQAGRDMAKLGNKLAEIAALNARLRPPRPSARPSGG